MTTATCRALRKTAPAELRPDGMAAPHRERVSIGVEELTVKSPEGVADRDHEIDGAGELRREDRGSAPWHDVEPNVRRLRGNFLHQRWHQKLHREVGHHQPKAPLAAGRIKIVGNEKSAHLVERLRQRPAQRLGPRRQFHARADANQQGIAEHLAQPLQGVARGRLRQADPHRGPADIGLKQERVKRDEQVQVERIQIHEVNIYHIHYRLEECRGRGHDRRPLHERRCRHERDSQQETDGRDFRQRRESRSRGARSHAVRRQSGR